MASIISQWLGWFGRDSGIGTANGTQNPVPAASMVDDVKVLGIDSALQLSTVWACVDRRATTIASLPFFAYTKLENGQKLPANNSLLYQLLHEAPNARMTPYDFWRAMVLNHDLRGNAYARLERNSRGDVVAMWPLPADQVEVQVIDGQMLYYYKVGSDVAVLAEQNVLHLRNLGNGTVGLSKLDYMRVTTDEMAKSQSSASKIFGTSGKPTGVLMVDKVLTNDQRDKIKSNFAGMSEGSSSRLFLLEANMKYQQLSLSPEDQQLLETRRFSVEEICRWYDVPPVLVHHSNVTTWGSGIEQIVDGFYKLTIRPMLVAIEQAVRRKVLTPAQRATMTCEFGLDALLRGSPVQRAELYSKNVQNGIMTRNECRQLENLPPMKDADDLTAQTNLMPLGKLGEDVGTSTQISDDVAKTIMRYELNHEQLKAEIKALRETPKDQPSSPVINNYVTSPDVKNHITVPSDVKLGDTHHHHHTNVEGDTHNWPAPVVNVTNDIKTEPTPITLEATINNEVPAVQEMRIVGMPDRVTTSSVQRDSEGNIIKTTQIERDL